MDVIKRCMDCGHYIPGGSEINCSAAVKGEKRSVCALKEACGAYVDREDEEQVQFSQLQMRKPRKRRSRK